MFKQQLPRFAALFVAVFSLASCSSSSESVVTTTSAPATSADKCVTTDLTASTVKGDAGAGQRYVTIALKKTGSGTCTVQGFPKVSVSDAKSVLVPEAKSEISTSEPALVALGAEQSAYFDLRYSTVEANATEACPPATELSIVPPDETRNLVLPLTNVSIARLCQSSGITVTNLRATENPA